MSIPAEIYLRSLPVNAKKNTIEANVIARNNAVVERVLWEKKNTVTNTPASEYANISHP